MRNTTCFLIATMLLVPMLGGCYATTADYRNMDYRNPIAAALVPAGAAALRERDAEVAASRARIQAHLDDAERIRLEMDEQEQ